VPAILQSPPSDAGPTETGPDGAVDVVCPATAAQLPVLRAIATSIALRADADLDLVADLRLAVDEACTTLIRSAGPEEPLRCRFSGTAGTVSIDASVWSEHAAPAEDELGALLLASLADQVSTEARPLDGGYLLRTSLFVRVTDDYSVGVADRRPGARR
jgi:serine/threonine-protein kinase RsbW